MNDTLISLLKSLCSLCVAFRSLHVMLLLIPGRALAQRTSSMLSLTSPLIDIHNSSTNRIVVFNDKLHQATTGDNAIGKRIASLLGVSCWLVGCERGLSQG